LDLRLGHDGALVSGPISGPKGRAGTCGICRKINVLGSGYVNGGRVNVNQAQIMFQINESIFEHKGFFDILFLLKLNILNLRSTVVMTTPRDYSIIYSNS